MNVFFLCIFLLLFSSQCKSFVIDVILSFILLDSRPTTLLLPKICWSHYNLKSIARSLHDAGITTATSLQKNRSEHSIHYALVIADLSCPGTNEFLIMASNEGYLKAPYRWLLLTAKEDLSLDGIDAFVDSDVVIAQKISDQEYLYKEVYKISRNSEVIYYNRALWIKSNPLMVKYNNSFSSNLSINKYGWIADYRTYNVLSSRRNNLRRHTLAMMNVVTDSNETRKHMDDRLNLHQDLIAKISYAVVKECFQLLNASVKLMFTHTWGYKDKNGQWQGLVDHLIRKEADLGTVTLFTVERQSEIDYIAMVGPTPVRFVFRKPPLTLTSNIFALPFTISVWLAILFCVLACSFFLYIASKWEVNMSMGPFQPDGSMADVLILTLGAVLQQGCTLEPRQAAGRFIMLILFVALTVLYSAYSANIIVLLRAPNSSIKTLADLLNSPFQLGANDIVYNHYFFQERKETKDPVRKAINEKKVAPKGKKFNFYSMKEGIEKLRKGLFAFHMEVNPGYRLIQQTYLEDEKCDLVEIDYLVGIDPWVPGQKRSPFKELFKIHFLRIRESGVQANLYSRLTVGKPKCSGIISSFSSIGVNDLYPALMMTLYGILLASAVFIIEITYKRLIKIKNQKRSLVNEDSMPFRD